VVADMFFHQFAHEAVDGAACGGEALQHLGAGCARARWRFINRAGRVEKPLLIFADCSSREGVRPCSNDLKEMPILPGVYASSDGPIRALVSGLAGTMSGGAAVRARAGCARRSSLWAIRPSPG
jgi:hypothetical protein